jgi:hypothetical protein
MNIERVPLDLRERLGDGATASLVELLDDVKTGCASEVMGMAGDRFERRLIEETSALRVEMARGFAAVRQEIAESRADVRQEIVESRAAVRQEIVESRAAVRQEMVESLAALRQDMAHGRGELLRWAFVFWVGQFFAMASLVAFLVQFLRPAG